MAESIDCSSEDMLDSCLLMVSEKPIATACSSPVVVNKGQNVDCLCRSIGGNPPANASWVRDGTDVVIDGVGLINKRLVINNVREADMGKYWCKVESLDLFDETAVDISVTYKPLITFFLPDVSLLILGSYITIICIGDGYPQPKYTLLHNGTILLKDRLKVVYPITRLDYNNSGEYKCQATNNLGSATKTIKIKAYVLQPIISPTGLNRDTVNCDDGGTKWYISVITLLCGILIGAVIKYGIGYIRRRKKKLQKPVACPEYATPSSQSEAAKNNPVYQELNLEDMKKEDNYQALKRNRRSGRNNEVVVEDESGYQELNKVRQKGDNYQSLNRV